MKIPDIKSYLRNGKRKLKVLMFLIRFNHPLKLIKLQLKRIIFHFFIIPLFKIFSKEPRNFFCYNLNEKPFLNFKKDKTQLKIPFHDDLLFCEIYLDDVYNTEFLKEGMTVIDVGAHIGFYSLISAAKVKENGKIIAVEPEPKNFSALLENIKLNNFKNITPINVALSDHDGREKLFLKSSSTDHSFFKSLNSYNFINVKVKTLDSLLEELKIEKVDLIKIDTEGAEVLILKGAEKTLRKNPHLKLLVASYHYPSEIKEVSQFLEERGFKTKVSKGGIVTTF